MNVKLLLRGQLQSLPCWRERGNVIFSIALQADTSLPTGMGRGNRFPVAERQKFLSPLCKHVTSSHAGDLPTGMAGWDWSEEGLVCICSFSPSVCIRVPGMGGGRTGTRAQRLVRVKQGQQSWGTSGVLSLCHFPAVPGGPGTHPGGHCPAPLINYPAFQDPQAEDGNPELII